MKILQKCFLLNFTRFKCWQFSCIHKIVSYVKLICGINTLTVLIDLYTFTQIFFISFLILINCLMNISNSHLLNFKYLQTEENILYPSRMQTIPYTLMHISICWAMTLFKHFRSVFYQI